MVRGTFSPARAWRLAVGPASTRTLGRIPHAPPLINRKHPMHWIYLARKALLVAVSIALTACTSMRIVPTGSSARIGTAGQPNYVLVPGEVVGIKLRNGITFEFTLARVSSSELEGFKLDTPGTVVISLLDIETVERRQFDALKTTLLVVAIAVGVYFVAKALLVSKILGSS